MRTLSHIASIFCLLLMMSSVTISCVSIKSHLKYTHRSSNTVPIDAFAFVMVHHKIKPDVCLPSEREDECLEIIEQLPSIESSGSGSGLLVWTKTQPVFLTAAHFVLLAFASFLHPLWQAHRALISFQLEPFRIPTVQFE